MSDDFFAAPQAAAVLKHGILSRYLPVFATMTGSRSGEVVYLDGYAGPGLYDDGSEGSPALALQIAELVAAYRGRATLHGHLVERSAKSVARLRDLLQSFQADWDVHHGRADDVIPGILSGLDPTTPLFAFIDPFGLPISFDLTTGVLRRGGQLANNVRHGGAPTEILMNFSVAGINRVGGQLTGAGTDPTWLKARDTMVRHMDEVLGGGWWQELWTSQSSDRVDRIRQGYKDRLRAAAPGWGVFDIEVSDRWKGPAAYHLLLFTQHSEGVWQFHEAVSSAMEEYRTYCHEHEGILDLEPLSDREALWVEAITNNLREILDQGRRFRPVDRISDVYGDAFGDARTKHLRKALKAVHTEGLTPTDCVGVSNLGSLWIEPASPASAVS